MVKIHSGSTFGAAGAAEMLRDVGVWFCCLLAVGLPAAGSQLPCSAVHALVTTSTLKHYSYISIIIVWLRFHRYLIFLTFSFYFVMSTVCMTISLIWLCLKELFQVIWAEVLRINELVIRWWITDVKENGLILRFALTEASDFNYSPN